MEDRIAVLKKKLAKGLKELVEIKVELDRANGTVTSVPHYSVIENSAHQFGWEVGRTVQERHARALVAQTMHQVTCPGFVLASPTVVRTKTQLIQPTIRSARKTWPPRSFTHWAFHRIRASSIRSVAPFLSWKVANRSSICSVEMRW